MGLGCPSASAPPPPSSSWQVSGILRYFSWTALLIFLLASILRTGETRRLLLDPPHARARRVRTGRPVLMLATTGAVPWPYRAVVAQSGEIIPLPRDEAERTGPGVRAPAARRISVEDPIRGPCAVRSPRSGHFMCR